MKFAQLLWLLEVHTFRLLCFVGCQERVPWHACWSWGHHPRVGFLAFVNSREHNVHSSHKLKIASSGRRGGVSSKGASFNFILPLHWAFRPEILANGMLASSPSPFPQFFLCWQGRNRKICRVFWVSVQNNVLFWRFTIFFSVSDRFMMKLPFCMTSLEQFCLPPGCACLCAILFSSDSGFCMNGLKFEVLSLAFWMHLKYLRKHWRIECYRILKSFKF